MQCPLCINESLELMVRGEVEIDVCPRCRGVWLDRGEIDKLAGSGRAKVTRPKRSESKRSDSKRYEPRKDRDDRDDRDDKKRREDRKRRKKSFGEKIADVFDDILD